MSDNPTDLELERMLHDAMAARPEPVPEADLARAAMRIVHSDRPSNEEVFLRLSRVYRRNRLVGVVAAVLVSVILLLGGLRLSNLSEGSSSAGDLVQSSSSSSSAQSEFSRPIVLLTGEALLAALVLFSLSGPLVDRSGATVSDLVFH